MKVEITNKGLLSLIIDGGRVGRQKDGFCQSGPMDELAYNWANFLAFNMDNTPCLEVMGNISLQVTEACAIAATGRDVTLTVNGEHRPHYTTVLLNAFDEVSVGSATLGCKAYLAISGNWQVPDIVGSASTVMREGLGGLNENGQPLQHGHVFEIKQNSLLNIERKRLRKLHHALRPKYNLEIPINVIPGYQIDRFSNVAQQLFVSSEYTVTSSIDRMGYRLNGPDIRSSIDTMRSEAVHLGAVQVPPDGQPIVMMRDRQTLGGYPKLGCVNPIDINRLAQAVPGEKIHFAFQNNEAARAQCLLATSRMRQLQGEML